MWCTLRFPWLVRKAGWLVGWLVRVDVKARLLEGWKGRWNITLGRCHGGDGTMEVCIIYIYIYIHGFKEIVMNKCISVYIYIYIYKWWWWWWNNGLGNLQRQAILFSFLYQLIRISGCLMKGGISLSPNILKNIYPGPIFGIVDLDDLLLPPFFLFQKF